MKKNTNRIKNQSESVPIEYFNRHELMKKLSPVIDNTLMRFGLIPVETEFIKENRRWYLRIFIYSLEREVNIDDCEHVSRSLAGFLDELIPVKYYLEVSSPGADRKLKSDKEYLIFKGRDIELKLKENIDETGIKQFKAKIADYDENTGLTVFRCEDNKEILIKKDNILSARLYFDEI